MRLMASKPPLEVVLVLDELADLNEQEANIQRFMQVVRLFLQRSLYDRAEGRHHEPMGVAPAPPSALQGDDPREGSAQ